MDELGLLIKSRYPLIGVESDEEERLDPRLVRRLREIAQQNAAFNVTLVLSAPSLELPPELRSLAARYRLRLPDEAELRQAVLDTFRDLNRNQNFSFRLNDSEMAQLVRNLRGLTLEQARRAVSRAVLDDGVLDARDLTP